MERARALRAKRRRACALSSPLDEVLAQYPRHQRMGILRGAGIEQLGQPGDIMNGAQHAQGGQLKVRPIIRRARLSAPSRKASTSDGIISGAAGAPAGRRAIRRASLR